MRRYNAIRHTLGTCTTALHYHFGVGLYIQESKNSAQPPPQLSCRYTFLTNSPKHRATLAPHPSQTSRWKPSTHRFPEAVSQGRKLLFASTLVHVRQFVLNACAIYLNLSVAHVVSEIGNLRSNLVLHKSHYKGKHTRAAGCMSVHLHQIREKRSQLRNTYLRGALTETFGHSAMEARRLRCRLGGGHFKTESVKARCSRYLQSTLRPVAMCVTRDENLSYGLNATEAISSRQAISSNEVSG